MVCNCQMFTRPASECVRCFAMAQKIVQLTPRRQAEAASAEEAMRNTAKREDFAPQRANDWSGYRWRKKNAVQQPHKHLRQGAHL